MTKGAWPGAGHLQGRFPAEPETKGAWPRQTVIFVPRGFVPQMPVARVAEFLAEGIFSAGIGAGKSVFPDYIAHAGVTYRVTPIGTVRADYFGEADLAAAVLSPVVAGMHAEGSFSAGVAAAVDADATAGVELSSKAFPGFAREAAFSAEGTFSAHQMPIAVSSPMPIQAFADFTVDAERDFDTWIIPVGIAATGEISLYTATVDEAASGAEAGLTFEAIPAFARAAGYVASATFGTRADSGVAAEVSSAAVLTVEVRLPGFDYQLPFKLY